MKSCTIEEYFVYMIDEILYQMYHTFRQKRYRRLYIKDGRATMKSNIVLPDLIIAAGIIVSSILLITNFYHL